MNDQLMILMIVLLNLKKSFNINFGKLKTNFVQVCIIMFITAIYLKHRFVKETKLNGVAYNFSAIMAVKDIPHMYDYLMKK